MQAMFVWCVVRHLYALQLGTNIDTKMKNKKGLNLPSWAKWKGVLTVA